MELCPQQEEYMQPGTKGWKPEYFHFYHHFLSSFLMTHRDILFPWLHHCGLHRVRAPGPKRGCILARSTAEFHWTQVKAASRAPCEQQVRREVTLLAAGCWFWSTRWGKNIFTQREWGHSEDLLPLPNYTVKGHAQQPWKVWPPRLRPCSKVVLITSPGKSPSPAEVLAECEGNLAWMMEEGENEDQLHPQDQLQWWDWVSPQEAKPTEAIEELLLDLARRRGCRGWTAVATCPNLPWREPVVRSVVSGQCPAAETSGSAATFTHTKVRLSRTTECGRGTTTWPCLPNAELLSWAVLALWFLVGLVETF